MHIQDILYRIYVNKNLSDFSMTFQKSAIKKRIARSRGHDFVKNGTNAIKELLLSS